MGCWNYQIFCDDTAMDALDELVDSESLVQDITRFLDETLSLEKEYLEYDECQYGLVAAALVDVSVNGVDWSLLTDVNYDDDDEYLEFVKKIQGEDLGSLKDKAIKVLKLAKKDDSELRELWEENEELYPKWSGNLDSILQRIKSSTN